MQLKVIDLFSGAGLFSRGFVKEGFVIVQAIELDPIAASTYRKNIGSVIENIDVRLAIPVDSCDVLIAGPPCQGFSTLGRRNPKDERNQLSLEILRWVKASRPMVIVVENVGAFLDHPVWFKLKASLEKLGYDVNGQILNAYEFGVPQIRKRSFTIASKLGQPIIKSNAQNLTLTVREAWQGLPPLPDGINHHYAPDPSDLALARMQVIPEGGDRRDIMKTAPELVPPSWWRLGSQVTDVWGRLSWNGPSNTIRTAVQNASKGRYIHPEQNRVISLREAARLHSIEDTWTFEGLPTQIGRQIGNSVPPLLGQAVAKAVRSLFV